jgi:hypothetical protein
MTERRIVAKLDDVSIVFHCTRCKGELVFHPKEKGDLKIAKCPQCAQEWIKTGPHFDTYTTFVVNLRSVMALEENAFTVSIQLKD